MKTIYLIGIKFYRIYAMIIVIYYLTKTVMSFTNLGQQLTLRYRIYDNFNILFVFFVKAEHIKLFYVNILITVL